MPKYGTVSHAVKLAGSLSILTSYLSVIIRIQCSISGTCLSIEVRISYKFDCQSATQPIIYSLKTLFKHPRKNERRVLLLPMCSFKL